MHSVVPVVDFIRIHRLGCPKRLDGPTEPGQACNVQHAANTHPCTSLSGNPKEGTWFVILKEGAYKTCGPGEPGRSLLVDAWLLQGTATEADDAGEDSDVSPQTPDWVPPPTAR